MKVSAHPYRPGFHVWRSGIYEVRHHEDHRSAHVGELMKGETFPYCRECKSRVRFHFKNKEVGTVPALAYDLSFKANPPRATAAALFKAAFGRRMTKDEKLQIVNYEDNWKFPSK